MSRYQVQFSDSDSWEDVIDSNGNNIVFEDENEAQKYCNKKETEFTNYSYVDLHVASDTKIKMDVLEVREGTAPLYCKYYNQSQPQTAELTINFKNNTIGVDYDGNIGNSQSMDSWHGREISFTVPNDLSQSQCENLLETVKPMAEKLAESYSEEWDGSNYKGKIDGYDSIDPDETEIGQYCRELEGKVYVYDTWMGAYENDGIDGFLAGLKNSPDCDIDNWGEDSVVNETIEEALEYNIDEIIEYCQENPGHEWLKERYPDLEIYFVSLKNTPNSTFGIAGSENEAIEEAKDNYIVISAVAISAVAISAVAAFVYLFFPFFCWYISYNFYFIGNTFICVTNNISTCLNLTKNSILSKKFYSKHHIFFSEKMKPIAT